MQKLVTQFSDPHSLNANDAQFLDQWLSAGLDRGLWAEYRAWAATLAIYQDGLKEGLWQQIHWLDDILAECPAGTHFSQCLYGYLDRRSPNPTEGALTAPLLATALQNLRQKQRTWKVPLDLGILQAIAQPPFK
ncbi:hypothetical protein WDW37_00640 [Bdellovibrionota bacterium FG-1]